jgi:hypothetical protein
MRYSGNFIRQGRRDNLVGIQVENPGLSALVGGGVLLGDKSSPGLAEDFGAARAGDRLGLVSHFLIQDNDDLTGPWTDALEGLPNPAGFSPGNHAYRNGQAGHRMSR